MPHQILHEACEVDHLRTEGLAHWIHGNQGFCVVNFKGEIGGGLAQIRRDEIELHFVQASLTFQNIVGGKRDFSRTC